MQVRAILDLRLHRLTALGRDEIGDELKELATEIEGYLAILGDRVKLYAVMREELEAVDREFSTPRLCEIAPSWDGLDDEGDKIGRGVYIYRLSITTATGEKADKLEKLVILR